MKPRFMLCLLMLLGLAAAQGADRFSAPARTFLFTYQVTLKDLPDGTQQLRLWIPRPVSDANQTVVLKQASGPARLREYRDASFGNHLLYGIILHPSGGETFTITYQVTRKEYSRGSFQTLAAASRTDAGASGSPGRFLQPDRLVPTDGRIKQMADEVTHGKQGAINRAYAIYDYVFRTVRYDKSGTGWGRGDSLWVCDARHGNCTDFHSLFISMARAEGIPARFEIGFPISEGAEGTVAGYHCWAEFYVAGQGWIPVDISEAWKAPGKHDYFFGSLDADRVQFSVGRDLTLKPKQQGAPLNYFIYPYAEADGKPLEGLEKKFTYREIGTGAAAPAQRAAR